MAEAKKQGPFCSIRVVCLTLWGPDGLGEQFLWHDTYGTKWKGSYVFHEGGGRVTESQSGGVGRDLWISSTPTRPLKRIHLEQVAQDGIQGGLESLRNFSGQPVLALWPVKQEFLLAFRWSFLCSSLCLLALVCLWAHSEEPGPIREAPTL